MQQSAYIDLDELLRKMKNKMVIGGCLDRKFFKTCTFLLKELEKKKKTDGTLPKATTIRNGARTNI